MNNGFRLSENEYGYCSGLTSVTIGDGVVSIGGDVFSYCKRVKTISIGSSVTSIAANAFKTSDSIQVIYMHSATPPSLSNNSFTSNVFTNATLYVPVGSRDAYLSANIWWLFDPDHVKEMDYSDIQTLRTDGETDGSQPHFDLSGRRIAAPNRSISIDAAGRKVVVAN